MSNPRGNPTNQPSFDPFGSRSEISAASLLLLFLLGFAAIHWSSDAIVVAGLWEDIFVPWDAGARWSSGLWPSLDFPSALGPLYYALQGVAFEVADGAATAVTKSNVLAMAVTLPALLVVLFKRFPPVVAAAAALSFGLWMISPRQADFASKMFAHLASYNRQCLIWSTLVILVACLPRLHRPDETLASRHNMTDGSIAGFCLLACYWSKISFAVFAGVFFVVVVVFRCWRSPGALAELFGAALAVMLAGIGILELTAPGISLAYISDIQYAASIQSEGLIRRLVGNLGDAFTFYLLELLMAAVALIAIIGCLGLKAVLKPVGFGLASLAVLAVLMGQVHDIYAPAIAIGTLVVFGAATPALLRNSTKNEWRLLQAIVLPVVLVAASLEGTSILQHALYAKRVSSEPGNYLGFQDRKIFLSEGAAPLPAWNVERASSLSSLAAVRDGTVTASEWNATGRLKAMEFYEIWQDVTALLAESAGSEDRIFCLAFANGCPVLTGTRSPSGGMLWWHEGRSYALDRPPAHVLDTVTIVAVPKVDRFAYGRSIRDALLPQLNDQFVKSEESPFWTLYRRR